MSRSYIDYKTETVTFPHYTSTGAFGGYQEYKWKKDKTKNNNPHDSRYFTRTYIKSSFWGLEFWEGNPIVVGEGIFDVAAALNLGYDPVALFSYKNTHILNSISLYPREKILLVDPDRKTLKSAFCYDNNKVYDAGYFNSIALCETNDANDCTLEELANILNSRIPVNQFLAKNLHLLKP